MIRAVESKPTAPIRDNPSGPDLGKFSDTNPIMVGQKKHMPTAKTPAAAKAAYPCAYPNHSKPMNENIAERNRRPVLDILFSIAPALYRPTAIIPLINTNSNIEGMPIADNSSTIHWFVPSSVAPVKNMQQTMNINNGLKHSFIISLLDTPIVIRSDSGNFCPKKRKPYNRVGGIMTAICAFQPSPYSENR